MGVVVLVRTCVEAQARGSAVRHFTPFWFSVEPADTLAVRGAPAALNCSALSDSSSPARVEWKKDGTFLNLASDDRRLLLSDGSLLITSVLHSKHNKPDEGVYQCVASIDNLGTIVSRTARLTVAGQPRFSSQPEAASVRLGDSVVLPCDVNPDLAPFARWERNKEPLDLGRRLVLLPSGGLLLSNASESDAGAYRCVLENLGPAKASEEAQLLVLQETEVERKLEFLLQLGPLTKTVGDGALMPCVVSGFPAPEVRWLLGDKVIEESEGRFEVLGGGSLQILNLTEEDAGIYTCVADNGNETVEAQAELTIQVPPRFLKRPSNIHAHESRDIVFECDVTGSPPPTVKWVKNGDAVIPSDYFKIIKEHNLQVLGLVTSDEGFYQCLAENDGERASWSAAHYTGPRHLFCCGRTLGSGTTQAHASQPSRLSLTGAPLPKASVMGLLAQLLCPAPVLPPR
ncbi:hypothetical protein GJAV_G00232900 [Gymnothorax javanicus]|nr:hypothetical protein GJAV_G00232900 [Gymnothorax javanicus]